MRVQVLLGTLCVLYSCWLFSSVNGLNLVCYFSSWAIYRNLSGEFHVNHIDPNLCTHLCFAFIELFENGSVFVVDPWASNDENDGGHYHQFRDMESLKSSNPNLKILLSLGGWNEGSKNFSIVSADPIKRKTLINEILPLIEKYNFDGLDVDWEYPTLRDHAHPEDKENFVALLKDFSEVLKPRNYLLTAAVAGAVDKIDSAYHVEQIVEYLDMLNLMTYDYHGAFDDFVGHVSPLHASPKDYEHGRNATYTVATGLEYWIYKNADLNKLNMGVPMYGRTFTLADKSNNDLYAPVIGPGERGLYTGLRGTLGYHEICEFYYGSDSQYYWDDDQKVPHIVNDDLWIGYDNERSMELKVDFAMSHNIAGIMVWSMDTDDFNGLCGSKYPLINTIKNRLLYHEQKAKEKK